MSYYILKSEPCIRCGMPMRRGTYCLPCEQIIAKQRATKANNPAR